MRKSLTIPLVVLGLITVIGSFTPYRYIFYIISALGFGLVIILSYLNFAIKKENNKLLPYIQIALRIGLIYVLMGVVLGLAIGTVPENYYLKDGSESVDVGLVNGVIISFGNLTTLSITEYSPQSMPLKFVSIFETIFGLFLFAIGIGIMINESTK